MIKDVRHLIMNSYHEAHYHIDHNTLKRHHIPRKYTCNTIRFQGIKSQYIDSIVLSFAIRYAQLATHVSFVFIINAISRLNYVFIAGML